MTLLLLSWTKIPTAPTYSCPTVRHVGGLLFPEEILIELNAAGVIEGIDGAKCEFGTNYGK